MTSCGWGTVLAVSGVFTVRRTSWRRVLRFWLQHSFGYRGQFCPNCMIASFHSLFHAFGMSLLCWWFCKPARALFRKGSDLGSCIEFAVGDGFVALLQAYAIRVAVAWMKAREWKRETLLFVDLDQLLLGILDDTEKHWAVYKVIILLHYILKFNYDSKQRITYYQGKSEVMKILWTLKVVTCIIW